MTYQSNSILFKKIHH